MIIFIYKYVLQCKIKPEWLFLIYTLKSENILLFPHLATHLFYWQLLNAYCPAWEQFTQPSVTRGENVKLTSGVSFGFELILTHFDVAMKSLTEKYCTFRWRSDDCPSAPSRLESQQTALMRLNERGVKGINCSISLSQGEGLPRQGGRREGTGFSFGYYLFMKECSICWNHNQKFKNIISPLRNCTDT